MAMSSNKGCCVKSRIMPNLAAYLIVLLLILEVPARSSARFMVLNLTSVTPKRGALETKPATSEATKPSTLAFDLMQFQHVNSPYATPNITLPERVKLAVKSSMHRANYFAHKISGNKVVVEAEAILSSPVFSEQGSYIMEIGLGTPTRNLLAIADTGSDLVWVQCSPCTDCFSQPDPLYNPAASSSYDLLPCTAPLCETLPMSATPCSAAGTCLYNYSYGDQSSTEGDLASETLTLSSSTGSVDSYTDIAIGCGTNNQGSFQGTDGLVGLGQGDLSLVSQLGSQIGNVFSYCLVDFYSATTTTSPLLLGSVGPIALTYTPLVLNEFSPSFYYVNLNGITINGNPVDYPADAFAIDSNTGLGGMILDSGTTITQMASAAYTPFLSNLSSLISYPQVDGSSAGFDFCCDISGVTNPVFPDVVFQFENVDVALPADNLFLQVDNASTVCLAFQGGDLGVSIFGNIQQQNFQIGYDLANGQVGFAPTTC